MRRDVPSARHQPCRPRGRLLSPTAGLFAKRTVFCRREPAMSLCARRRRGPNSARHEDSKLHRAACQRASCPPAQTVLQRPCLSDYQRWLSAGEDVQPRGHVRALFQHAQPFVTSNGLFGSHEASYYQHPVRPLSYLLHGSQDPLRRTPPVLRRGGVLLTPMGREEQAAAILSGGGGISWSDVPFAMRRPPGSLRFDAGGIMWLAGLVSLLWESDRRIVIAGTEMWDPALFDPSLARPA